ncbi:hypothetical protein BGZ73_008424 [Actinomortierella ambigua]|nr:hypothetical protein BGZ73_008424 [Actinomortierella ambigua]
MVPWAGYVEEPLKFPPGFEQVAVYEVIDHMRLDHPLIREYAESPLKSWDELKESVRKVASRGIFTKGKLKEERTYGAISSSEDVGRKEACVHFGFQVVPTV